MLDAITLHYLHVLRDGGPLLDKSTHSQRPGEICWQSPVSTPMTDGPLSDMSQSLTEIREIRPSVAESAGNILG